MQYALKQGISCISSVPGASLKDAQLLARDFHVACPALYFQLVVEAVKVLELEHVASTYARLHVQI